MGSYVLSPRKGGSVQILDWDKVSGDVVGVLVSPDPYPEWKMDTIVELHLSPAECVRLAAELLEQATNLVTLAGARWEGRRDERRPSLPTPGGLCRRCGLPTHDVGRPCYIGEEGPD